DRSEQERVDDWSEHLRIAPSVLLITEKARKGECEVTLELLEDLAVLATKHDLVKKDAAFSLVCPEGKVSVPSSKLEDIKGGTGAKRIKVKGVEFRISFVEEKDKPEKQKWLPTRDLALFLAGM